MKTCIISISALLIILCAGSAFAELKTIGEGANMNVDISTYPNKFKAIYPNFVKKCIKCHGMDRTFVTLQSGITPSGATFDNAAIDAYGAKMLRKPDADMSKQEVRDFVELMKFLAEEAAK